MITVRRKRIALVIAALADAVQIGLYPGFIEGALSIPDDVLDAVVAVALVVTLGWRWRLVGALALELVPGIALFPSWTAFVATLPSEAPARAALPRSGDRLAPSRAGSVGLSMCGRTTLVAPPEDLKELFGLDDVPELVPRYNVAPTQPIAVIRQPHRLEVIRWGLILPDARLRGAGINVRVETVARVPAYRGAFRDRRCLVVVDGFYEWQRREKVRQPFAIRRTDHKPFALAGIWVPCTNEGEAIDCCAILTGPATGIVTSLHDRMPMIVPPRAYDRWLSPETRAEELPSLMAPDASELEAYPVSKRVNSADNDGPECIERAEATATTLPLFAS